VAVTRRVKDDDGNEYEIELDDDDDDDEEDEDDENIYLTEKDLRWLKEQRKAAASGSRSQNGTQATTKKRSSIAVKKAPSQRQKDTGSQKKSRVRKLTI
jgi:enterochelin esterase-like enzyme